jgi:hypothetical protein
MCIGDPDTFLRDTFLKDYHALRIVINYLKEVKEHE